MYFSTSSVLPQTGSTSFPMHFLNTHVRPPTYTVRTEVGMEVEVSRVTEHDGRVVKHEGPWKGAWPGPGHDEEDGEFDADGTEVGTDSGREHRESGGARGRPHTASTSEV